MSLGYALLSGLRVGRIRPSPTSFVAPLVTGCTPNNGPSTGGTTVVITGQSFISVQSVKFGGIAAAFAVDSQFQITATAPAHAEGLVDIEVATSGGRDARASAFTFTGVAENQRLTESGETRLTESGENRLLE